MSFRLSSSPGVGRQHQPAVRMQAAGLAGERLDLAIQIDGVFLQARDVGLAIEGVHAAGGVPGRAGGQFALLEQQHVGPADLGEVIEHAGADHAAADDDRSRGSLHDSSSPAERQVTSSGDGGCKPERPWPRLASHSRKCRAVLAGVSSSSPDGSAARITDTCAMIVARPRARRECRADQDPAGSRARAPRGASGAGRIAAR